MAGNNIDEIIAKNLRKMLAERGKNQVDLANYVGVSGATASNWCNGRKVPRMDKIDKICAFLMCSRADLMEDHTTNQAPGAVGELSADEIRLVLAYRAADPARRSIAQEILDNSAEIVSGSA